VKLITKFPFFLFLFFKKGYGSKIVLTCEAVAQNVTATARRASGEV
jgi:hypothetical protein